MLGGVCVWGWRLDAARHADIRAQLEARDAEALSEVPVLAGAGTAVPLVLAAEEATSPQ